MPLFAWEEKKMSAEEPLSYVRVLRLIREQAIESRRERLEREAADKKRWAEAERIRLEREAAEDKRRLEREAA
ncbi:MAG: hypothetical protein LBT89_11455, partial [Planctomycetaceae bacterium]|nr:hypothetical protein [Planctomycetaceae bacterium]